MCVVKVMEENYKKLVLIFKALADETRIQIVQMLCGGELCACKILENFNITQPTLSYHMKILTESGLVSGRRDGAWMKYSLKREGFETIRGLCNLFCSEIPAADQKSCQCN